MCLCVTSVCARVCLYVGVCRCVCVQMCEHMCVYIYDVCACMGGLAGAEFRRLRRRKHSCKASRGVWWRCWIRLCSPQSSSPGWMREAKKRQRRLQDGGTERKRGSEGRDSEKACSTHPRPQERVQEEQAEQSLYPVRRVAGS